MSTFRSLAAPVRVLGFLLLVLTLSRLLLLMWYWGRVAPTGGTWFILLQGFRFDLVWFEQLYAAGTRSVRGIEAVISGFPPTSRRSVVKLAETQDNFFTIAGLLQERGFQTVVDENDYENPQFLASWGVSDEDLLQRAD